MAFGPVDTRHSNWLELARETYWKQDPTSTATVSADQALYSDDAPWNFYTFEYERVDRLAQPYMKIMQLFAYAVKDMQFFVELKDPLEIYARCIYTAEQEEME